MVLVMVMLGGAGIGFIGTVGIGVSVSRILAAVHVYICTTFFFLSFSLFDSGFTANHLSPHMWCLSWSANPSRRFGNVAWSSAVLCMNPTMSIYPC